MYFPKKNTEKKGRHIYVYSWWYTSLYRGGCIFFEIIGVRAWNLSGRNIFNMEKMVTCDLMMSGGTYLMRLPYLGYHHTVSLLTFTLYIFMYPYVIETSRVYIIVKWKSLWKETSYNGRKTSIHGVTANAGRRQIIFDRWIEPIRSSNITEKYFSFTPPNCKVLCYEFCLSQSLYNSDATFGWSFEVNRGDKNDSLYLLGYRIHCRMVDVTSQDCHPSNDGYNCLISTISFSRSILLGSFDREGPSCRSSTWEKEFIEY